MAAGEQSGIGGRFGAGTESSVVQKTAERPGRKRGLSGLSYKRFATTACDVTISVLCASGPVEERPQDLGEGRRRRNEDESIGRLCSAAFDSLSASSRMAKLDALREERGFCFSVPQGGGPCSPLRVHFRCRSSAAGRRESRSTFRERAKVRASQSSPLTQQLVSEQSKSRTQNRAGH